MVWQWSQTSKDVMPFVSGDLEEEEWNDYGLRERLILGMFPFLTEMNMGKVHGWWRHTAWKKSVVIKLPTRVFFMTIKDQSKSVMTLKLRCLLQFWSQGLQLASGPKEGDNKRSAEAEITKVSLRWNGDKGITCSMNQQKFCLLRFAETAWRVERTSIVC